MILWRYLCVISICGGSAFAVSTHFHGNESDDDDSRTDGGTRSVRLSRQKMRRSIKTEDKRYIEIAIVIDNVLFTQLDDSIDVNVQTVVNNVNLLYSSKLNVNIQLVAMETWNTKDQISISENIEETLQSFQDFNTRILSSTYSHDSAYLLSYGIPNIRDDKRMFAKFYEANSTAYVQDAIMQSGHFEIRDCVKNTVGQSFTNSASTNGISSFRALCSRQGSTGVIQVHNGFNVSSVSAVLAHLIGVSLGMPRDSTSCSCPSGEICVMNSTNVQPPSDFSVCSKDAFSSFVQSGRGWCLKDSSNPLSTSAPICGNGIIESNEQCDCGSEEECAKTSCCNRNCTLTAGSQCSRGTCCSDNCKFLGKRKMCRPAHGQCDIPEFCTGKSSQCPKNIILLDGQSCNNKQGVCVSNACLSSSSQCSYLWGKGAKESDSNCYPDNDSTSRFCQHIYCDVTSASQDRLITETASVSMIDNRTLCRAASVTLPGIDLGLVFDGISCGSGNGTCSQGLCREPSFSPPDTCPGSSRDGYCSSNGVCNSNNTCVCSCGWTGTSCKEARKLESNTIDLLTGSVCPPLSTTRQPKDKGGRQTVTKIFQPDPPPPPAETSKDPATFMSSAIIGGSVAIIFVVAVIFGATSVGFRVKRSRMRESSSKEVKSIFQPTPKQKQKLDKMENHRIMKNKRLKERLEAHKKARKSGGLKGPSSGSCCTGGADVRFPKDRTTERLLIDMETEYRPSSRTSNETVM